MMMMMMVTRLLSAVHRYYIVILHSSFTLVLTAYLDVMFFFAFSALNKKAARVEVNISLAILYWVGIALHS